MMRVTIGAAAAAMLAACGWSNPYDTSDERDTLKKEDAQLLELEREQFKSHPLPQQSAPSDLEPPLVAWQADVLQKADANGLKLIDQDVRSRIALLKARLETLNRDWYRVNHYRILVVQNELAVQERKLALIEQRGR